MSTLPSQTGLGSSSSFIVGLLNAFHQLNHNTPETKTNLGKQSILIEREDILLEKGGWQDGIWAAEGGVNSITISKSGEYRVRPLPISKEFLNEFHQNLVLFYTGQTRKSYEIADSHDNKDAEKEKKEIHAIAKEALIAFSNEDIKTIGKLLDESWQHKRKTSKLISTKIIDDIYTTAKNNGCCGFKLLGAGQSGFVVCLTEDRHRLIKNIDLPHIDFNFDYEGSKIILS